MNERESGVGRKQKTFSVPPSIEVETRLKWTAAATPLEVNMARHFLQACIQTWRCPHREKMRPGGALSSLEGR